jgi:hypothetical protein
VQSGSRLDVHVWNDLCRAVDQGDAAADLISTYLGRASRLVAVDPSFRRDLGSSYAPTAGMHVRFADSSPCMLASSASLDDLNQRLETPVPMDRFRPNLVVGGYAPFEEDRWDRIRIGSLTFRVVKDCIRCQIINIDQSTGERDVEPLETLATYRSGPYGVRFGRKLVQESTGSIGRGDRVDILE